MALPQESGSRVCNGWLCRPIRPQKTIGSTVTTLCTRPTAAIARILLCGFRALRNAGWLEVPVWTILFLMSDQLDRDSLHYESPFVYQEVLRLEAAETS